jgi:C-terminal processing protease CtpA/Prc
LDRTAVVTVTPGTPAEAAGVVPGDVIVRVDGASAADPASAISRARGPVVLTIERNGRNRETLLQP